MTAVHPKPYVRVVEAPDAILDGELIDGYTAGTADSIDRDIAAVVEGLDGPGGVLGRALGPQTLELVASRWCDIAKCGVVRLPYPPLIGEIVVTYLDTEGVSQTFASSHYRTNETSILLKVGESWPSIQSAPDAIRIRYRAGYDGDVNPDVPSRVLSAVIMMVNDLRRSGSDRGSLRSEEIDDIRTVTYADADKVKAAVEKAANGLLSTLKVYTF